MISRDSFNSNYTILYDALTVHYIVIPVIVHHPTHVHTRIHLHTHTHTVIHARTYTYTPPRNTLTLTHTYPRAHIRTHTNTHKYNIYTHVHVCTQTHLYTNEYIHTDVRGGLCRLGRLKGFWEMIGSQERPTFC